MCIRDSPDATTVYGAAFAPETAAVPPASGYGATTIVAAATIAPASFVPAVAIERYGTVVSSGEHMVWSVQCGCRRYNLENRPR